METIVKEISYNQKTITLLKRGKSYYIKDENYNNVTFINQQIAIDFIDKMKGDNNDVKV